MNKMWLLMNANHASYLYLEKTTQFETSFIIPQNRHLIEESIPAI